MNSKTAMFLVKRILMAILTIFIVITITFFVMQAVPGNPFLSEKAMDAQRIETLTKRYGLDRPLVVQWLDYSRKSFIFDFGISIKTYPGKEVSEVIFDGFGYSALNGLLAATVAIIFGIILGVTAAVNRGKIVDRIIMIFTTAMVAVPSFVIAAFFLYWFCVKGPFPINYGTSNSALKYIMPVIALSLYPMSYITRLTRTSTLDVLGSDYVRTAKAKGVSPLKVLFKHTLRNSLTPVISYAGPMIAFILTGSLVVENIFSIPGLGNTLIKAINNSDYPLIMGMTVFISFLVIFMILVSDFLYKVVNPRVDLE